MRPSLDELLATVDELSANAGCSRGDFLIEHGLAFHDTLERWTYASTPLNSLTFASTGGDGVHFGVLLLPEATTDRDGPVVMTVPMARNANHVVAESLREFLGLGCTRGWFSLEQLAYRAAYTFELYAHAEPPSELPILQLFAKLSLEPRSLDLKRLEELAQRYTAKVILGARA